MPALSTSKSYNPVLLTHLTNPGPHRLSPHYRRSIVFVRTVNGLRGSHGRSVQCRPKLKATPETKEEEDDEDFVLLVKMKSPFNDIMIVDSPSSRMLLLDTSFCVHSVLYKGNKWSDSYWDEFASLPPIVPKGPIAILGLGGGTSAHLMLDLWPELQLEGWEIDKVLIDCARDYFGLADLEKPTESGGVLNIHIGDALSPSIKIPRGYAGIIVDLFSNADVLPQLKEVSTWLKLKKLLMPNGRIMVNCGGTVGAYELTAKASLRNASLVQNSTIKALSKAFPGQLSWKIKPKEFGANQMALTGPMPELESWSAMVPGPLSSLVKDWFPYSG